MKKQRVWVTVLVAAAATLTLASAAAAQQPRVELEAEIPFEFYVGGEAMPAGTYHIETFPDTQGSPVLSVEKTNPGMGEAHFVAIPTRPAKPIGPSGTEGPPRLVFESVGDVNLLVRIVPASGPVREVK